MKASFLTPPLLFLFSAGGYAATTVTSFEYSPGVPGICVRTPGTNYPDCKGSSDYLYPLLSWRLTYPMTFIVRNYVSNNTISSNAIASAASEIQSKLGYSSTSEYLPWNQGPYQNRLLLSENNYGSYFDALSLAYIVNADGSAIDCSDYTPAPDPLDPSKIKVTPNIATGDNGNCNISLGKMVNAGILVFNNHGTTSPYPLAKQTHLVLHEFAHLFGLGHYREGDTNCSKSIMLQKMPTDECPTPLTAYTAGDTPALNCLKVSGANPNCSY